MTLRRAARTADSAPRAPRSRPALRPAEPSPAGLPWRALLQRRHWALAAGLAVVFAALAGLAAIGRSIAPEALYALVPLAPLAALLAVVDARGHVLPNALQLPGIAGMLLATGLASWAAGEPARIGSAAGWAAGLFAASAAIALASPASLGFGDVKLLALLGLPAGWLGPGMAGTWLALAFVSAGVAALALVVARRATRHTQLPLGPYLIAAFFAALPLQ